MAAVGDRILPMLAKSIGLAGLILGTWSLLATAQQPDPSRLVQLQSRLERIESIRAIKRLQYAYGHYTELGLWNDFADLFTDDASTNYQQGARGKAEVRKLFFEQVGQGKLGLADGRIYPHILFQPVITLAPGGRTAKGRWRILAMLGGYGGGATWYSGVYENEYVREDGVWKISVLRSEPKATASYAAAEWKDSGVRLPTHYSPSELTVPVDPAVGGSGASLNDLARRAARLRDQADVTNVLDSYGYAVDARRWAEAAGLFAKDGTLELGLQGVYVGNTAIRRALRQLETQALNEHVYLQTVVTVAPDGRTANARGVELIFSSNAGGELAEGTFENSFVKQNGTWKLQSVHFYPRMIVDAALGWAKSAKPAPRASTRFPPSRPATTVYEIYPKFSVAPFHFNNPVTGNPPQYPEGVRPASNTTVPATAAPTARLADLERNIAAAEAYEAAENLLNAYGYTRDNLGNVLVDQVLQPVVSVSADGNSATIRARTLDLRGVSGGVGGWTAGRLDAQVSSTQGSWDLRNTRVTTRWSAPYPGGWGRVSTK